MDDTCHPVFHPDGQRRKSPGAPRWCHANALGALYRTDDPGPDIGGTAFAFGGADLLSEAATLAIDIVDGDHRFLLSRPQYGANHRGDGADGREPGADHAWCRTFSW